MISLNFNVFASLTKMKIYPVQKIVISSILFGLILLLFDVALVYLHLIRTFGAAISLNHQQNLLLTGMMDIITSHLLLVIILVFFTILFILVFEINKKFLFYIVFIVYIFLFPLIHYPQLFHSMQIDQYLPKDRGNLFSGAFVALSLGIACFILLRTRVLFISRKTPFQRIRILFMATTSALFLYLNNQALFGFEYNDKNPIETLALKKESLKPIFVISIDALNSDADDLIKKYANSSLSHFLEISKFSNRTIADVTQTHGSMVSLFSGLRPYETEVRYPFHPTAGSQSQEVFKTFKEIKNQGYKITVMRDEMVTAAFFSGSVIDQVLLPLSERKLNKFAYFYSSILTYGVFDNWVGHYIFPEAYGNSSYYFGNNPNFTAERFKHHLAELANGSSKELLFFHSCVLHAPLVLPYPYYPKEGQGKIDGIRFSYPTPFKNWKLEQRAALLTESPYNAEIYEAGVRYLVENLLNPIFLDLKKNGYLDSATIFLVSDHGENLWNHHKKVPANIPIPFHGDTLLFGSKNDFAYFRVLNSMDKEGEANQNEINLSQHFRKSLGLAYDTNIVYTENSYIPLIQSKSLIKTLDFFEIQKQLRLSPNKDYLIANDSLVNPALMQKQKAVFSDGVKLTAYPTLSGKHFFLCGYITDPLCLQNLIEDPKFSKIKNKLFRQLAAANSFDIEKHLDVRMQNESISGNSISELKSALQSPNDWIRFRSAEIIYFRYRDFNYANLVIRSIFENTKDKALKRIILETTSRRCYGSNEYKIVDQSIEYIHTRKICNDQNKNFDDRDGGFSKLQNQYDKISALADQFNLPEAQDYLKKVQAKYDIKEKESISKLFKLIPSEKRNREAIDFLKFIKQGYEYFFNYDLAEEQVPYYFIKFYVLKETSLHLEQEILKDINRQPTGLEFENVFFAYISHKYDLTFPTIKQPIGDYRLMYLRKFREFLTFDGMDP